MKAKQLANKIVVDILTTHDGRLCHRIQKLSGQYPDNEHGEGGLCQSALESLIAKHLVAEGYPPDEKRSAFGGPAVAPNDEIRRVVPWGYELWKHMHDEHGLLLLESELHEIILLCERMAPTAH